LTVSDGHHPLAALLDFARRTVPFYGDRIPEHAESMDSMPVLTRQDVQQAGPRLWSTEGDRHFWRRMRTTGTTGEPLEIVLDKGAQRQELVELERHLDRLLGPSVPWRTRDVVHLTLHRSASTRSVPSPWHPDAVLVKWNLSQLWPLPDKAFRAALGRLDGHIVTAMPSVMRLLTDRLCGGDLPPPSPLVVTLSGESSSAAVRDSLARQLSCAVTATYTLAEVGCAATLCPETDGYHPTSTVVTEIVQGELVVTSTVNRAMPMIRYRTGDQARWLSATACGCQRPLFRLRSARRGSLSVTLGGRRVNAERRRLLGAWSARPRAGSVRRAGDPDAAR